MSTKLSITYAILVVVLIGGASLIFYNYNKNNIYQEGISNISQMADSTMEKVDNRLTSMEQVAVDVLTDNRFLPAWNHAVTVKTDLADREVRRLLTDSYENKTDIRRVSVFNEDGYFVSTGEITTTPEEVAQRIDTITQRYKTDLVNSRIFLAPHTDNWGENMVGSVISEIKPIKNASKKIVGYIEVQQNVLYLRNSCDVKWNANKLNTMIFMGSARELFYRNFELENYPQDYVETFQKLTKRYAKIREDDQYIIAMASSNYYEFKMIFVLEKTVLYKSMKGVLNGILIVSGLLIVGTLLYIIIVTRVIMKPINSFIVKMQKTDLSNFTERQSYKNVDYETEILLNSYDEMARRLQKALAKQKQLEDVQTKTLFSILQSEISPHFLYNTMGSIANMCEQGENEAAADACYNLTDLIRYSSNYAVSEVTVREEIENLKCYMEIMKSRYRQRLEYEMEFDQEIQHIMLPKLTLQPLVENAIKYSLLEEEQVIIKVLGVMVGDEMILEVKDNGCGISQEARELIEQRIEEFEDKSGAQEITSNIQIGGMGLSGTLIRLSIYFEDAFSYELAPNNDEGGTSIVLKVNVGGE